MGLLAHVDAGKTTLAEAMLALAGTVRSAGRVDHRDTCLDPSGLEKSRGITIFANMAPLRWKDAEWTLLDTPGHADFSPEAERTLPVLDAAILVISGSEGVQAHTETLWRLLEKHGVPTVFFVSKMDRPGTDARAILAQLTARFGEGCVAFGPETAEEARQEALASLDETALNDWDRLGRVPTETQKALFASRKLFPCLFGSGLCSVGVEELMDLVGAFCPSPAPSDEFGARCFRVLRDEEGNRMTLLRVTGGCLRVRDSLSWNSRSGERRTEKAVRLRIYTGGKYVQTDEVSAGGVCAVMGPADTWPGCGFGCEPDEKIGDLVPVLSCRVVPPEGCDSHTLLEKLRQIEDSNPELGVRADTRSDEIRVRLMGRVQGEILQSLLEERFGLTVRLEPGRILYLETITVPAEGVGHFEPLRHYAEVHLLLQPLERGSGLVFDTVCPTDELEANWQHLILSMLRAKVHAGVLTGAPVTDMRVTLVSGRAHEKHTEGGDFREAAWRALRQGLMQAQSRLLEPWYAFTLSVPAAQLGRAISDLQRMGAEMDSPETDGVTAVLRGRASVARLREYGRDVAAYTGGKGRLGLEFGGYEFCTDGSVVEAAGYDPEADQENPPHSVFCAHGAGFTVNWRKVPEYMHLPSCMKPAPEPKPLPRARAVARSVNIDDRELEEILRREFGPNFFRRREVPAAQPRQVFEPAPLRREHLIVDGYNLIFDWDGLRSLALRDFSAARARLVDLLASYRSWKDCEIILVFDGYRVRGGGGEKDEQGGVRVVYTRENETADAYIQRLAGGIGRNDAVRVITNDGLIRLSALGSGVQLCSCRDFRLELESMQERLRRCITELSARARTSVREGAGFKADESALR